MRIIVRYGRNSIDRHEQNFREDQYDTALATFHNARGWWYSQMVLYKTKLDEVILHEHIREDLDPA